MTSEQFGGCPDGARNFVEYSPQERDYAARMIEREKALQPARREAERKADRIRRLMPMVAPILEGMASRGGALAFNRINLRLAVKVAEEALIAIESPEDFEKRIDNLGAPIE